MTATIFIFTDPSDFCRNRCVKGRIYIDLPGGKWTSEPCHWCGGSGQRAIRIEEVKATEGMRT